MGTDVSVCVEGKVKQLQQKIIATLHLLKAKEKPSGIWEKIQTNFF